VYIAGGSTTTTTGCTIVGFDDNTYETAKITTVSGGTLTANFAHAHNSAGEKSV
jgi:hypothetical protein